VTDLHDDYPADHDVAPAREPDEDTGDDTPLAWEGRVFAVAITWAIPGVVFGLIVGLFAAISMTGSAVTGGLIGALAGGLLEADYWS
jgi:hypothetical protein